MIAELQCVVLDCPDPARLARFYAVVLGGEADRPDRRWALGEDWATVHTPSGLVFCFQRVQEYLAPAWPDPARPPQAHLDFAVPDLDRAQEEVLALGATLLDGGDGVRGWRVFADPAGHPFCLLRH
ncbi:MULTISPECIES: VOC family protein [Streptomyces]|uniref:VOC family protein n=2 Tax=Streptomyces TaxID=1883 RepID=A0A652KQA5_9ACTN|nr:MULTISPECIES: VOC family protein [unclassified Streptomyces]WSS66094.1 VOC family protein [Streptomyces sp. NBC_01177]WSS80131.1 VOC family protein [Streptomyces sp. NBC_01174]MDX3329032.1 VOC family protein [Streptomyces sp. ME02-6979-3A]MDX3432856.1 VOC family protein [Streptomyces sp. ME01-18a]TXS25883.1 VOC family protein [Streptomyces sp. gb1(2016)]